MTLLEAIILGILQGVAEFLPISSSAHLALLQYFMGLEDTPRFFDVMLHVGTLAAVLAYYRANLWPFGRADRAWLGSASRRLAIGVVLATLPAVAAGLAFRPTKVSPGQRVEDVPTRSWRNRVGDLRERSSAHPEFIIGFLAITGVVLVLGSRARGGSIALEEIDWKRAILIGLAQAASAVCPGLSRSGMTVSTAMLAGVRGESAVHFSLLMSVPAVVGAVVLKSRDLDPTWLTSSNVLATVVGTVVSAVVGWFSIGLLVGAVRRGRWWWFAIYVWALSGAVAAWLLLAPTKPTQRAPQSATAKRGIGSAVDHILVADRFPRRSTVNDQSSNVIHHRSGSGPSAVFAARQSFRY